MGVFNTTDSRLTDLFDKLNEYHDKTRTGKSTGLDYQSATNLLRDAYDKGHIPQEAKNDISKQLKFFAQNAGRSLSSNGMEVVNKIRNEGGYARKVVNNQSGFAKMMPMLGLGATAIAALGAIKKAQAGDLTGAALDTAEVADPTGVVGAIKNAKQRLNDPEFAKAQAKEDKLNAIPAGMQLEQAAIDSNDEDNKDEKPKKYGSLMSRLLGY